VAVGEDGDRHPGFCARASASDRLGAAARRAGAVLVVGANEREPHGGTIYNTVLTFGPDGTLMRNTAS